MGDPAPDVLDASHQLFLLAFDLVETEIDALPEELTKTLKSPAVQASIKKTLLDYAKTKAQAGDSIVSGPQAQKLADALGKETTDLASRELVNAVRGSPEYLKLESTIRGFRKAAESSTLGVWVDRNKKILYIVGAALMVGGGTVLYVSKTGGGAVNAAVGAITDTKFEVLQVGKLSIKASLWDFQPDARILGGRVYSTMNWDKLKVDLQLGVLAQGAALQQIEGAAIIKSGAISLNFSTTAKPQAQTVNLGMKVGYEAGRLNLGIGAMYEDNQLTGTASLTYKTKHATFGAQANVGDDKQGTFQYGALLTMSMPVGH